MEDLEEYVSIEYNEIDIPSKEETMDEGLDEADRKEAIRIRKEMKKAKAHMVCVSQEYPRLLVITALTPREAYTALKEK